MTEQQKTELKRIYFNNRDKRDRPYYCADCGQMIDDKEDVHFMFDKIAYGLCESCFKTN